LRQLPRNRVPGARRSALGARRRSPDLAETIDRRSPDLAETIDRRSPDLAETIAAQVSPARYVVSRDLP